MRHRWLIVLLIVVVAAVFRLNLIKDIPPGLYPDEAMNGNNAVQALETGDFQVFYPENNGREGLFMNLQAISISIFGNQSWALRLVSALFGIFTVLGVYFLAARLFNWQVGAISSFLLAISFWHVLFSRIGFRAIMAPFFLVWALFFFWRGLQGEKLYNFLISGVFWGLGFYSYISFRVMPLVLILVLLAHWQSIHKSFTHEKYLHARNWLIRGTAFLGVTAIIVFLPLGYYFWNHPGDFFGRTGQLSIFASEHPFMDLLDNTLKTLGMFNFTGDWNWRHNYSGSPELFWPVGILFIIGLWRGIYKIIKTLRRDRRLPTVQVLLFLWFIVGLLPVIISDEGIPHALRAILVVPATMIFAAEGLWWAYDKIRDYYQIRDVHTVNIHRKKYMESSVVAVLVVILFLAACGFFEYDKYFNQWAKNGSVQDAFAQNYVDIGRLLNELPKDMKKYVLVNAGGVKVPVPGSQTSIAMPAQTVMFITDSWTYAKQKEKNIFYLTQEQYNKGEYDKKSVILPLQ